MKIKEPQNTIFGDNPREISVENFKNKVQYYFTGQDLEEITSISIEKKTSKYWVKVETKNGTYTEKISCSYGDSKMVIYAYDPSPLFYQNIEKFVKDFKKSTDKDFRILNGYKESLERKEKEMKEVMAVRAVIQDLAPEYFL